MPKNRTKRIIKILFLIMLIVLMPEYVLSKEYIHQIIYSIENSDESADIMYGISLPKNNIKTPNFIEILDIIPSNPVDIAIGQIQDFIIRFKLKEINDSGMGIIKLKFDADPDDQLILPPFEEETIWIEDTDSPNGQTSLTIPVFVYENEPQSIYVSAFYYDDWSGINIAEQPKVTIGSLIKPAVITPLQTNKECIISAAIQSPVQEGTYEIVLSGIKDNAGNEAPPQKMATLLIIASPRDQPSDPGGDLEPFASTISSAEPPRFGRVKIAIFRSGYALEMKDLLTTFGEAAEFIRPEEFSPSTAAEYQIVIIPSAALAR